MSTILYHDTSAYAAAISGGGGEALVTIQFGHNDMNLLLDLWAPI